MKRILSLMILMATTVVAVEKHELMPLLETAATNRESAYVEIRNKIVAHGEDALLLLAELGTDDALPWQQRLVARICYERIKLKEKIIQLIETDWYKHPKFNPDWNGYITGPEIKMGEIVVPELKDAGFWYYYLELVWKATSEEAKIHYPNSWAIWCIRTVKDSPEERIWLLRVYADLIVKVPSNSAPPPRLERLQVILQYEEKPDAVFLLEHRAPPPTPEPPFRLGTKVIKIKDE